MQPVQASETDGRSRALMLERVTLAVRHIWFDARVVPLSGASCVIESGGKMVMVMEATEAQAEELLAWAADRDAYVVTTSVAGPADLHQQLALSGFRPIQRRAVYLWAGAPAEPVRRTSLLPWRTAKEIAVVSLGEPELPVWNAVCWRAFGSRGTEADSLAEKRHAFAGMGQSARWYLALADGRPAGTAVLYQNPEAAQVMAVGTLPSFRGRGVATAVMKRVIADWEAGGDGPLFLDTAPGSNAERLYRRLGFTWAYQREVFAPPAVKPRTGGGRPGKF